MSDLPWIQKQYEDIGFLPSDFEKEMICIAEVEGKRAGLGRLKRIDERTAELGGIYVLPLYRGTGLARTIVSALMGHAQTYETVYCLPYAHLLDFYRSFGFSPIPKEMSVPQEITEKLSFCFSAYDTQVLLLIKQCAKS